MSSSKLFTVGSLEVHAESACLYGDDQRCSVRIGPFAKRTLADTFAWDYLKRRLERLVKIGALEVPARLPRVSPHIPATEEYEVLDVNKIGFGALLRRSDFYKSEAANLDPDRLGIMVDMKFFQDSRGRVHAWPVVHWEGRPNSTLTCPRLVELHRKAQHQTSRITIDNGQWGTHGPPTDS